MYSTQKVGVITNFDFGGLLFSGRVPLVTKWHVSIQLFFKNWKFTMENILFPGKMIIGDNAYICQVYMAVTLKG